MNVIQLAPFGIEVTGLDLSEIRSPQQSAELLALFNQSYLLLVRNQNLSDDDHRRVFHDLFPGEDLGDESGTGSEISYVSNVRADGLFGDDALSFHSDFSFTTEPTRLISLYGFDVESGSAATEFSSGELALQTLPADLRAYLRDKKIVSASDLRTYKVRVPSYNLAGNEDLSGRSYDEIVRAAWPVILNHPRTGRPLLYVNELHAHHFQDVPLAESREVLQRLCEHLYKPQHIFSHDWQRGDFLLWDNIALAHGRRATAAKMAKRTLRRVRGGGATSPTMVALGQRGLERSAENPAAERELSPEVRRLMRELGKRVRSHRVNRGLTQQELGHVSGLGFNQLSMCEMGHWVPNVADLFMLANSISVDPSELLKDLRLIAPELRVASQ